MAACLSVMCSAERTFSKKFVGHLANLAADKVLPAVRAMLVLLLCFPPALQGFQCNMFWELSYSRCTG